jgi:hypothetical protein
LRKASSPRACSTDSKRDRPRASGSGDSGLDAFPPGPWTRAPSDRPGAGPFAHRRGKSGRRRVPDSASGVAGGVMTVPRPPVRTSRHHTTRPAPRFHSVGADPPSNGAFRPILLASSHKWISNDPPRPHFTGESEQIPIPRQPVTPERPRGTPDPNPIPVVSPKRPTARGLSSGR